MANPFDGEMLKGTRSAPATATPAATPRTSGTETYSADPLDDWRRYEGVRTRRVTAFLIDYAIVIALMVPVALLVLLVGLVTFGVGWLLFGIFVPLVALPYVAFTLGGRRQATVGMQMMGIRLARTDGKLIDPLLAVVHTVLFWAGNVVLSPLILLSTLVLDRKRTIHDLLLGTVVVREDAAG